MKKIGLMLLIIAMLCVSCKGASQKTSNISEATKLTKAFYEELFAQEIENEATEGRMGNAERIEVVKRKYLIEDLIEELHLRSRECSCDAITNSQDDTEMRGKLEYTDGKDADTGLAIYKADFPNGGYAYDIFELHFIDVDGEKLADELNVYHQEKMSDGSDYNYEKYTKYANNGGINEEKRAEMEKIKKELDDLEAQGYIG